MRQPFAGNSHHIDGVPQAHTAVQPLLWLPVGEPLVTAVAEANKAQHRVVGIVHLGENNEGVGEGSQQSTATSAVLERANWIDLWDVNGRDAKALAVLKPLFQRRALAAGKAVVSYQKA